MEHHINTGDATPIRQPAQCIPFVQREEIKKLLKEMEKKKIIQPSKSPWASPVVLVKKKDGSMQFCVDYRKLNAVTRKDAYPLLRIDDTLQALSGSQWFSTLDLLSGYWQVGIAEEDKEKTAFTTQEGLFEFNVMPFGLCNAPATFQRLMDLTLAGMLWAECLVYLDDVIIFGRTFEEHLSNLRSVLKRLREANLKVKPSKCALFQKQVLYLGYIILHEGVATDPDKTKKISTWPKPTNLPEVQKFLGLSSYYRRFIPKFAEIARPLHRLTERGRPFKWTIECDTAFAELKLQLCSSLILTFPDFSLPFILDTDASQCGIGAVLSQKQNGEEKVIAYASRTLTKAERKYSVTRKELLVVVTYIQHFKQFLLGRPFTLRTDHGSLQWIQTLKEPEGQLARWLERLQDYNFEVQHRKGCHHQNADALSRYPTEQCKTGDAEQPESLCRDAHYDSVISPVSCVRDSYMLIERTLEELRKLQQTDDEIGPVLQALEDKKQFSTIGQQGKSRSYRLLLQQWDQLYTENGLLFRRYEDTMGRKKWAQFVVPQVVRKEVLSALHNGITGGHLGEDKTRGKLQERFYWPGHTKDVRSWCQTCSVCAARKSPVPRNKARLQSIHPGYPLQLVAMDLLGPLPESTNRNSYVLVVTDYFTRYTEAYALPNQEAKTVAYKLVNEFFFRYSLPEQLHSDQGRQFESDVIKEVTAMLQIKKTRTSPYHPQSDGLVERFNRTLLSMFSTALQKHPWDWEDHIRQLCYVYNTSVHPGTHYTPFFLMFGRQARLPVDVAFGLPPNSEASHNTFAASLRTTLQEAFESVRTDLGHHLKRQKEIYDVKAHGQPYEKRDVVWLHNASIAKGNCKKFNKQWVGPYKVTKRISDATYRIQLLSNARKRIVVHFDRLKAFNGDASRFDVNSQVNLGVKPGSGVAGNSDQPKSPRVGEHLELCDDDDDVDRDTSETVPGTSQSARRYPSRVHQPPTRFSDFVAI